MTGQLSKKPVSDSLVEVGENFICRDGIAQEHVLALGLWRLDESSRCIRYGLRVEAAARIAGDVVVCHCVYIPGILGFDKLANGGGCVYGGETSKASQRYKMYSSQLYKMCSGHEFKT